LINRIIQLLVLVYIGVYAIWLNRGYQKTTTIEGVLYTKVKGLSHDQNGYIYDSGDLVIPPIENNALFVATRALNTFQTENGECPDPEANCTQNSDCKNGSQTNNGFVIPICDPVLHKCHVAGWCPVENESLPFTEFSSIETWTIFMRSSVTYSAFNISTNNANKAQIGYNIFSIADMTKGNNFSDIHKTGAIMNIKIDWSCDLDLGIGLCTPQYYYIRTDTGGSASVGFNFRRTIYVTGNSTNSSAPLFSQRMYTKFYGIRFVFQIQGTGRKFDVVTTVITVGSGVAFFGIASIATDFILQYLHPKKKVFGDAKRQQIDLAEMGNSPTASDDIQRVLPDERTKLV